MSKTDVPIVSWVDIAEDCDSQDEVDFHWEMAMETLREHMQKVSPEGRWAARGINMGWQKREGYKEFDAVEPAALLSEILPATEVEFRIHVRFHEERGEDFFAINSAHHDSPCWDEWFYVFNRKE